MNYSLRNRSIDLFFWILCSIKRKEKKREREKEKKSALNRKNYLQKMYNINNYSKYLIKEYFIYL